MCLHSLTLFSASLSSSQALENGEEGQNLKKPVVELLDRLTLELASSATVWAVCADFHGQIGNVERAFEMRQKEARTLATAKDWMSEPKLFADVSGGRAEGKARVCQ